MRMTLVDVKKRKGVINKDLAGGFGTTSAFGETPFLRFLSWIKKGSVNIPIMTLGYLSAILKAKGFDVRLSTGEMVEGTDVYLIYTSVIEHDSELEFSKMAKKSGALVGFVGASCSALPDIFLPHGDFVIRGEPEGAMQKGEPWNMKGVIDSDSIGDLDELPFPDWRIFDYNRFSYSIYLKNKPIFPILSSRGCPYLCGYYYPYPFYAGQEI